MGRGGGRDGPGGILGSPPTPTSIYGLVCQKSTFVSHENGAPGATILTKFVTSQARLPCVAAVYVTSPRAHLHVVGMIRFMSLTYKPTQLAHSFLFCSCVFFCLYGPFNCISFHKFSLNSPLSHSLLKIFFCLLVLSAIYLFMKVFLSPDIILCGWVGLKH